MNNKISLQRIKLLLRADWIEHRAQVIFVVGSFLAALIVFFLLMQREEVTAKDFIRKQYFFYGLGLFYYFAYFCRYVGMKVHSSKGLYLTLPANTAEKFITLLLEGFILMTLFLLLLWPALYGISLVASNPPVINPFEVMDTFKMAIPLTLFLASLAFLSYVTFRKYAFPIVFLFYALLLGGTAFIIVRVVIETLRSQQGIFTEMTPMYYTVNFLIHYQTYAFAAATLGVLYIAYLKLKEKELR